MLMLDKALAITYRGCNSVLMLDLALAIRDRRCNAMFMPMRKMGENATQAALDSVANELTHHKIAETNDDIMTSCPRRYPECRQVAWPLHLWPLLLQDSHALSCPERISSRCICSRSMNTNMLSLASFLV